MTRKKAARNPADDILLLGAEQGNVDAARAALAAGADLGARDGLGNTPLCVAASAGHLDLVELLLDAGADPKVAGTCDMSALTLAARDGRTDMVRRLLAIRGAWSERVLDDAIMVGSMSSGGRPEIVDLLRGARLTAVAPAANGMATADGELIGAAERGDAGAVEAALKAGTSVKAHDDRGMDALSWAALRGHDRVVEVLLDHGADVNALNSTDWPPLGQACGQGHVAVVRTLIARGADVNLAFDGGRTALMCAAYEGYEEVVKVLIAAGADPAASYDGSTARDLAVMKDHAAIVALLDG